MPAIPEPRTRIHKVASRHPPLTHAPILHILIQPAQLRRCSPCRPLCLFRGNIGVISHTPWRFDVQRSKYDDNASDCRSWTMLDAGVVIHRGAGRARRDVEAALAELFPLYAWIPSTEWVIHHLCPLLYFDMDIQFPDSHRSGESSSLQGVCTSDVMMASSRMQMWVNRDR
ncbi:hypothetical protein OG21DRAFT_567442 [Imleria badia]|nr:hypothetical protein OG21DRAFT_567442 [Imleria badia]